MFENFPYTDMHQLNLDWIIKIAKDFLDQYTHIQQLIADGEESLQNLTTEGLQQLQDKADNLEALLNEWYETHSSDIANQLVAALADLNEWYETHSSDIADQLAAALSDLNEWYTTHQGYLNQYLQNAIAAFNTAADSKAATTIDSIPADYTTLANTVTEVKNKLNKVDIDEINNLFDGHGTNNYRVTSSGDFIDATGYFMSDYITVEGGKTYFANFENTSTAMIAFYNNGTFLESVSRSNVATAPSGANRAIISNTKAQMDNLIFTVATAIDYYMRKESNYPNASVLKSFVNAGYSTAQVVLTDLDNAQDNTLYLIAGQNPPPAHIPSGIPVQTYYVLTIAHRYDVGVKFKHQYIILSNGLKFFAVRENLDNTWYDWAGMTDPYITAKSKAAYRDTQTTLTDLNDAINGTLYFFSQPDPAPANLPNTVPNEYYVLTLNQEYGGGLHFVHQYILNTRLATYAVRECLNGTWYGWTANPDIDRVITVDPNGSGNYTKLTDALADAYSNGNTTIYVKPGEYDITNEIDIATYNNGVGPMIGKNTKLIFSPNAKVKCLYSGSSSTFSVLNAGTGNFKVVNMDVICKNIRYCVHDELMGEENMYTHEFIDCNMEIDNSENQVWHSTQCIGGGLGVNGYIVVDGGRYNSNVNIEDTQGEISYHNTNGEDSKSKIVIKNVYFVTSTARFGYFGTSEEITQCFITNCSMKKTPILRPENNTAQIVNMEIIAWNNEIRNN